MSYVVLNDQTRQNLEQERSRLISDREKIVSEIESSVRAEVDQAIQTLNALLNEPPVETAPADEIAEAVTKLLDHPPTETAAKSPRSRKTGMKKSEEKKTANSSQAFDAKQLKRKFKGMDLGKAIVQVLQQDPAREYDTDALIAELYDKFDQAEMPKARRSLGATLMHQRRAGIVEKIGDVSPRYKLGQCAAVSA